jgi:hypothetical protein
MALESESRTGRRHCCVLADSLSQSACFLVCNSPMRFKRLRANTAQGSAHSELMHRNWLVYVEFCFRVRDYLRAYLDLSTWIIWLLEAPIPPNLMLYSWKRLGNKILLTKWTESLFFSWICHAIPTTLLTNTQNPATSHVVTKSHSMYPICPGSVTSQSIQRGSRHLGKYPVTMSYYHHLTMPFFKKSYNWSLSLLLLSLVGLYFFLKSSRESFLPNWSTAFLI